MNILYSIQLYDAGLEPKIPDPLTTDPVEGAEVVPAGVPAAVVTVGVVPVAGVVGLVYSNIRQLLLQLPRG